jgi:hypothetical protein
MNAAESYYESSVRLIDGGAVERVNCAECDQAARVVVFGDEAGRCITCGGRLVQAVSIFQHVNGAPEAHGD